jgi:hypothetical protein
MKNRIEELAEFMHDEYEKEAKKNSWETQKKTRVSFDKLPKENKETMLSISNKIFQWFREQGSYGYDDFADSICFDCKLFGEKIK